MEDLFLDKEEIMQQLQGEEISPEEANARLYPTSFTRFGTKDLADPVITPIECGFDFLDKRLFFHNSHGELIIVGAASGHGKSSFLLQLAANASTKGKVFLYSLEMPEALVTRRLLSMKTGISNFDIKKGRYDKGAYADAYAEYRDSHQLYVSNTHSADLVSLQKEIFEQTKRVGNPIMVIIDHIQHITADELQDSKHNNLGIVARKIHALSHRLSCPIVMAAQMNREMLKRLEENRRRTEEEDDFMPTVSHLADSSEIAKAADSVLILVRPEAHIQGERPGEADVYAVKTRDGECFKERLYWRGETTCFVEAKVR